MFDPALRPLKDAFLRPLAIRLAGRVEPLGITLLGLWVGLGAAAAAWQGEMALGLSLWLLNRVLDGLDGLVARVGPGGSDLGGIVDLVADFVVYAAIPLAMGFRPDGPAGLGAAAAVLLAAFYVNAAAWMVPSALLERRKGAVGQGAPTSVIIPEGLISGGETVVFFSLFFLFPDSQRTLFLAMAVLVVATVGQRMLWAIREFGPPRPARGAPDGDGG